MIFTILFYGGIVVALLLVWIEYRCAHANKAFFSASNSLWWRRLYKWRYVAAFALVPLILLEYPVYSEGEWYSIIGFPLVAAAFDSRGTDFVSAFTGIFIVIDAIILYFSIHIVLRLSQRWTR